MRTARPRAGGFSLHAGVAMDWARRLWRVFGIEIDTCQRCGGRLRIIASIEQPAVIAKILAHLARTAAEPYQPEPVAGSSAAGRAERRGLAAAAVAWAGAPRARDRAVRADTELPSANRPGQGRRFESTIRRTRMHPMDAALGCARGLQWYRLELTRCL